jgi:hypothetical protein
MNRMSTASAFNPEIILVLGQSDAALLLSLLVAGLASSESMDASQAEQAIACCMFVHDQLAPDLRVQVPAVHEVTHCTGESAAA